MTFFWKTLYFCVNQSDNRCIFQGKKSFKKPSTLHSSANQQTSNLFTNSVLLSLFAAINPFIKCTRKHSTNTWPRKCYHSQWVPIYISRSSSRLHHALYWDPKWPIKSHFQQENNDLCKVQCWLHSALTKLLVQLVLINHTLIAIQFCSLVGRGMCLWL